MIDIWNAPMVHFDESGRAVSSTSLAELYPQETQTMANEIKVSLAMRQALRRVKAAGEKGLRVSNTNATLNALEKRGLVVGESSPEARKTLCFDWKLTPAGEAFQ